VVDNEIEDFWREGTQRRGFYQSGGQDETASSHVHSNLRLACMVTISGLSSNHACPILRPLGWGATPEGIRFVRPRRPIPSPDPRFYTTPKVQHQSEEREIARGRVHKTDQGHSVGRIFGICADQSMKLVIGGGWISTLMHPAFLASRLRSVCVRAHRGTGSCQSGQSRDKLEAAYRELKFDRTAVRSVVRTTMSFSVKPYSVQGSVGSSVLRCYQRNLQGTTFSGRFV